MARQESTRKDIQTAIDSLHVLDRQVVDKDRTNAITNVTAIKALVDALNTLISGTSEPVDFDSFA